MESGRGNFIKGHDSLGWAAGTFMESGSRIFIMGYDPLGWGGNIHGIRKRKFYDGIRPFRVEGRHSWNQEEETLS